MVKVIGLVGKLQSGKTTSGDFILDFFKFKPCVRTSFANLLKEMILKAGLCTEEELWGHKTEFSRLMLQKIGTEIIRNQVDPDFWIKRMIQEIEFFNQKDSDTTIVIDDVRFINEAELIKSYNGTLIRINRPSLNQTGSEHKHASEVEQDKIHADYNIINNGSLEDLRQQINHILKEI